MKRENIVFLRSALFFAALTLGSLQTGQASNHLEAPLIDLDNKANVTDIYMVPKLLPTNSSGNQVLTGINDSTNKASVAGQEPKFEFTFKTPEQSQILQQTMKFQNVQSLSLLNSTLRDQTSANQTEQINNSGTFYVPSVDSLSKHATDDDWLVVLSLNDKAPKAPEGFQAGEPLSIIVKGTKEISNPEVLMSLTSADSGETVQVSGTYDEDIGAGIWGDQNVADFSLPHDLPLGFYGARLTAASHSTRSILIQISDPTSLNRRRALVQLIQAAMNDKYSYPYALVGPFRPLPIGAQINDSITGEVIATVTQKNVWLFFAYDPQAFFGQSDARWILMNSDSEEMQIIENREFAPEVVLADGRPYPLDYASHDHVYYGMFNAGTSFQDKNAGNGDIPENNDEGDSTTEDIDSIGPAIIGLSSTLKDCPPERIKTYAIILTFDDTDKRFIELKNEEKKLLKKLGINAANITELDPKDFLTDKKTFEIDPKTWTKSFAMFRSKLEAWLKTIDDCCAEVLIIVNSHANKDGMLKFKKAKDVKSWTPIPKESETIEVKPRDKTVKKAGKPGQGMNNNFSSGFLTQMIAETFKKMDKSCIPVALINHSCYSGVFESTAQNLTANRTAVATHPNLHVYASSSSDEKSYGRVNGKSYRFPFIDAIAHCFVKAKSDETRTLTAQWDCIVKETKKRASAIDGLQTPTKYPSK